MQSELSEFSQDEIKYFHKNVGNNVRKFREAKGLSQLELALAIDIKSVAFFSNCENQRYGKHFNIEHLYKISKVLNIDITEFFKFS